MKPRVLVVDDSALARRAARKILEEDGYDVEEASDGVQALERYFLKPHDLVLLDMVMTGMYGLEVLEKMRQIHPQVRALVLTADIQKSTAEQARATGAAGILNKPVNREALSAAAKIILAGGVTWN